MSALPSPARVALLAKHVPQRRGQATRGQRQAAFFEDAEQLLARLAGLADARQVALTSAMKTGTPIR